MSAKQNRHFPSSPLTQAERDEFDTIVGEIPLDEHVEMTANAIFAEHPILDRYVEGVLEDDSRTYDEKVLDLFRLVEGDDYEDDPFFGPDDDEPTERADWRLRALQDGVPAIGILEGARYAFFKLKFSKLGRGLVRAMDGLRTEEHQSGV